jgi:plastocyanin
MKLDITKLPVVEGIVGFLVVIIIATFVLAFRHTDEPGEAVSASPTPEDNGGPDGTPPPDDGEGPIEIVLGDNFFDPDDLTVQGGSTVAFDLTNEGRAIHNMHIAGPDGEYTEDFCGGDGDPCSDPNRIPGGQSGTLTWEVPDSPGQVDFRCDFHTQEMTGTITIE